MYDPPKISMIICDKYFDVLHKFFLDEEMEIILFMLESRYPVVTV
jgi:hypothetical protein